MQNSQNRVRCTIIYKVMWVILLFPLATERVSSYFTCVSDYQKLRN